MSEHSELKKFFSFKYNFYKERTSSKDNILMVDRQRIDSTIMNAMLALAVNKKYKKNVIILSDLNKDNLIIKFYKHLGFKKYLSGMNYFQCIKHPYLFIQSLIISILAVINIFNNGFLWFINNYKIDNIPFGDLIYDTNIRFHHRYINPKIDYRFIKLLILSTFRILLILRYFKEYNIKKIVVGNESYAFNPGVALRISIFKGIKNYYPGRTSDTEFEIATDDKQKLFLGRDNIRHKLIQKEFKKFRKSSKEVNNFYLSRKNTMNKKYFWTANNFRNANYQSKEGLNFIKKISKIKKKKILYASHAFSDAAHQKGLIYSFQDFYNQLVSTLSYVFKNDDENIWIFRAHPSSKIYNEGSVFIDLIKKFKKENIYICPKNVPIKELYELCDTVVTGSGTAGLEFICEGKQAILAGSAAYSTRSVTPYYAKNQKEYFKYLTNINYLKKPNNKQRDMAKKLIFFYESGKFIIKKIPTDLLKKDKIFYSFFLSFFGLGLNLKDYLNLTHSVLKKDIHKSKAFNEIVKLV